VKARTRDRIHPLSATVHFLTLALRWLLIFVRRLSLNHDDLIDSVASRLSVQDLDEIFRTMRTCSEGRLRLNRRRLKRTWRHGLSLSSETLATHCEMVHFQSLKLRISVQFTMSTKICVICEDCCSLRLDLEQVAAPNNRIIEMLRLPIGAARGCGSSDS
jgi:hypothetical protein